MPTSIEIGQGLFDAMSKQLDTHLTTLLNELRDQIENMVAQGIAPEEITRTLMEDIKQETGIFANLSGKVGSLIDNQFGTMTGVVANNEVADLSNLFEWVVEPTAEHCETCDARDGQQKTYEEWQKLGLPGAGTTLCKQYCKCSLMPI